MDLLVGYTGFVGSNLYAQHPFDLAVNSQNITAAFGTEPTLCVYAGMRSEKFLANTAPEKDAALIDEAIGNLKRIKPRQLVLISSIDVFQNPVGVNESSLAVASGLHPYGLNRLKLETWVRETIKQHLIVRLPALFGKNIKKNFIYDLINIIPSKLSEAKYCELAKISGVIAKSYIQDTSGFYQCIPLSDDERSALKSALETVGFSALNFTDSRAIFQFYNLAFLWSHIQTALTNKLQLLHLAVEPLSSRELYRVVTCSTFYNEITEIPPHYDFKTIYCSLFGGKNGYIFNKQQVLKDIVQFVRGEYA
jgi:hypothetical protein